MDLEKNLKDELNELAPGLSRLDKQEGFQVPPRYFEKLTSDVLRQVSSQAEPVTVDPIPDLGQRLTTFLSTLWQPRMAMSLATVALLVLAGLFFFNNQTSSEGMISLSDISDEELNQYFADNFDDYDQGLAGLDATESDESIIPPNISDEVLMEYYETVIDEIDSGELNELL